MHKVNLRSKFMQIKEPWKPTIIGELNDQLVKIVKVTGEFPWHFHKDEDELFFVIEGLLHIRTHETEFILEKDEFIIIPHGIEHSPMAENETLVMLIESRTTINTGNLRNEYTHTELSRI